MHEMKCINKQLKNVQSSFWDYVNCARTYKSDGNVQLKNEYINLAEAEITELLQVAKIGETIVSHHKSRGSDNYNSLHTVFEFITEDVRDNVDTMRSTITELKR